LTLCDEILSLFTYHSLLLFALNIALLYVGLSSYNYWKKCGFRQMEFTFFLK